MSRARVLRAAAVWIGSGALWLAACTTPGQEGELLYRKGDLRGAIDAWRAVDADAMAPRIAAVEAEIDERVQGYIANANALESEGRLAEALLDYRLALELRPDDQTILDHVQKLARDVVAQRAVLLAAYRDVRTKNDLPSAAQELAKLRRLDPFEPAYETEQLRLQAVIEDEVRAKQARARAARKAQVESLVEAGRAAFGDEQLETAIGLWRRALMIDPENERVQAYIARAEQQLQTLEQFRAQRDGGA